VAAALGAIPAIADVAAFEFAEEFGAFGEVHVLPFPQRERCHCENCRRYSAAPVSAFTLWKKEDVSVTKGEEFLGRFKSSDISERGYCTKCGGHIIVEHPTLGLMDVRIGALRDFPFKPKVHLNYAETVLPMKDGLPKLKDFPAEIGGSGETLPE
jgi:hypothetical protein